MVSPQLWHIWDTQQWPASVSDEQKFINALKRRTRSKRVPTLQNTPRASVTALVTTLRHGGTFQQLTKLLPGEAPADLLSAYNLLTAQRQTALEAWEELSTTPSAWTDLYLVIQAEPLLPAVTKRVLFIHTTVGPVPALQELEYYKNQIARIKTLTHKIEEQLENPNCSHDTRVRLGLQLHHLTKPCLWSHDLYIPRRVTDISPLRVADLLRERTDNNHEV